MEQSREDAPLPLSPLLGNRSVTPFPDPPTPRLISAVTPVAGGDVVISTASLSPVTHATMGAPAFQKAGKTATEMGGG